jgi:hypothetical protein
LYILNQTIGSGVPGRGWAFTGSRHKPCGTFSSTGLFLSNDVTL